VANYVIRSSASVRDIAGEQWDALLQSQAHPTPFMRHAYLLALQASASACADTGWETHVISLHDGAQLAGAAVLYVKTHSYGEYVFDWAWANAYAQHGLRYYPKAVVAVPFTPVPGNRLLARDSESRQALLAALIAFCQQRKLSSMHLLFGSEQDLAACHAQAFLLRSSVQFHWSNQATPYADFDAFLAALAQDKRKKIRQERRKVSEAGVHFRHAQGRAISAADWDFFYRCYERTYLEHGNPPYLSRDFFHRMAQTMPENWLLFVGERAGQAIACSLIALQAPGKADPAGASAAAGVAYGRYWGALERVDCLHFEACYYQPLEWCIAQRYQRFEGGAQGEHKMARALLPVQTHSAHWIAHPEFARAIDHFLQREDQGITNYLDDLRERSPLRKA